MNYFSSFTMLLLSLSVFFCSYGVESKNSSSKAQKKTSRPASTSVGLNEPPYNIWGWEGENRVGYWISESYKVQYHNYRIIQSPERCEIGNGNCIHLHIGCNFDPLHPDKKSFRGYIVIERHPEHPKTPLPFLVPSYDSNATVWLNEVQFDAKLERSSLAPAIIYGMRYDWTVNLHRELFDIIKNPVEQLTFRIKTKDEKVKAAAVFKFHLSKTYKHIKFMTNHCPRP